MTLNFNVVLEKMDKQKKKKKEIKKHKKEILILETFILEKIEKKNHQHH